jgi:hypothetical protein
MPAERVPRSTSAKLGAVLLRRTSEQPQRWAGLRTAWRSRSGFPAVVRAVTAAIEASPAAVEFMLSRGRRSSKFLILPWPVYGKSRQIGHLRFVDRLSGDASVRARTGGPRPRPRHRCHLSPPRRRVGPRARHRSRPASGHRPTQGGSGRAAARHGRRRGRGRAPCGIARRRHLVHRGGRVLNHPPRATLRTPNPREALG